MAQEIDWNLLAEAKDFYEHKGFKYIEVPWIVGRKAIGVTSTTFGWGLFPVGSGEQGFIQLMLEGKLPKGKYCTITPCFRDEPVLDEIHLPYFMKLELIDTEDLSSNYPLLSAKKFFSSFAKVDTLNHVAGGIIDLEINNIEVGSYGYREYGDLKWVYGTGLAEPRFSYAMNNKKGA